MSQVSRTVDVSAAPERVWALVSDLPAMGELSTENVGGRWVGGATGPAVGARFKGRNRNGVRRWSTSVQVTRCEPGRAFVFAVSYLGIPVAEWSYDIEPTPSGSRVTEGWSDRRPGWFRRPGGLATGVADRGEATVGAVLEHTLAAVKQKAEA